MVGVSCFVESLESIDRQIPLGFVGNRARAIPRLVEGPQSRMLGFDPASRVLGVGVMADRVVLSGGLVGEDVGDVDVMGRRMRESHG